MDAATDLNIAAVAVGIAPIVVAEPADNPARQQIAEEADRASRYRLVIEEGAKAGSFIYKMLDRVTGEVVRQLPREEVVNLAAHIGYDSGAVIDTRA
ncbi:flagellar protein FlaG [Brevundimonas lutea]|uniref:flagellar protein FlaG n=1 Tax=Brevundimonas lutea TaxID=2293980 RepID=UPI000F041CAF|nr:flagellar protein FlaG [Brevundimonas lutea]